MRLLVATFIVLVIAAPAAADPQKRGPGGKAFINAQASSIPLVLFGGEGNDTIQAGQGADLVFGDTGRADYRDGAGTLITRLGLSLAALPNLDNGGENGMRFKTWMRANEQVEIIGDRPDPMQPRRSIMREILEGSGMSPDEIKHLEVSEGRWYLPGAPW